LAIAPKKYTLGIEKVYFPKDAQAGGTWLATSTNYTLCLLNGAFQKHQPKPLYNKSRGQVIVDFFIQGNLNLLIKNSNFNDFENFTLIIIEPTQQKIVQLVWDGEKTTLIELDWQTPHIWSSCTLYSDDVIKKRQELFNQFITENPNPTAEKLYHFHQYADVGDIENNLTMKRPDGIQTQSISQINYIQKAIKFKYFDLIANKKTSLIIC
jgi:hypothetical protein